MASSAKDRLLKGIGELPEEAIQSSTGSYAL